jgi:hypothetical protein
MKFFVSILFIFVLSNISKAQQIGGKIGLVLNLGTHVNAIGINSMIFHCNNFYQLNLGIQTKYNFSSYGKRNFFAESRLAFGGLLLAGKKNNIIDFDIHPLNHNSLYQYALGYNYLWYFDELETSQNSGAWALHLNRFSILFENDVFGGQAKDRFRTGVLQFSYRFQDIKYFTNLYIWTGETRNSIWIKEKSSSCPNGYRSLENLPYGKTSHGILNVGMMINSNFMQLQNRIFTNGNYSLKIGLDSEHIRHFFQNKLTHDLILFPKKFKRNTPHYPRLDQNGLPVFEKDKVRKNKIYFQTSLNDTWSN